MKSRIPYPITRVILLIVVLATLLGGNVQGVYAAAPSNDDFDNATAIPAGATSYSDTINEVVTTATPQSSDPANDDPSLSICDDGKAGLATVWYKYDATASGILTVDTSGSGYNTVAAVWSGSRGSLTMLSCNNDYYDIVPNGTSYTSAYILSGTTYYIEIAQVGGVSGAGTLSAGSNEIGALAVSDQLVLNVSFDAVPVVGVGTYDDADTNWIFSGSGWTHATSVTGAYANTHSYTSTTLGTVEFNFLGDQFTLYYTIASNGGDMEVDIDNKPTTTIHENSSTTQYQQLSTSAVLSPGAHRLRLVRNSGTIYVDAIKIFYKIAPLGNIGTNYNPTYQWNQVPGATWYYFWLSSPTGKLLDQWYQASEICSAALCAVTPSITLGGGSYTWWVQTWNKAGYGPWSSAKDFNTAVFSIPAKTTLDYPQDGDNLTTNYYPTYTWDQVSNATWYYLWVNGPNGAPIIQQWYTSAQAACNGATCSVTPSTALRGGSHTWWIQTWNPAGAQWSDAASFQTTSFGTPAKATLNYPPAGGNIGTNYNPTYTWSEVSSATWYYLWVRGPSGTPLIQQWYTPAQAACNGTTCSVTPTSSLGQGNHTWWIQTWNPAGDQWSDPASFQTTSTLPAKATLNYPPDGGNLATDYYPTYTWNQASDATWYYLWVNGPSGNLINQWYSSTQAACNGTTCSVTPTASLGGGTHTWWVQTWNPAGDGPWSDPASFQTTPFTIPTKTLLDFPPAGGNLGTNYFPTYTWDQVSNATWYYLWVNGPSGTPLIQQWYTSAQAACNGTTCSVTPTISLGGGTNTWWIQTWNPAGAQWSDAVSFQTTPFTIPGGVP